jgi:predicted O-methyltransferase YrrM
MPGVLLPMNALDMNIQEFVDTIDKRMRKPECSYNCPYLDGRYYRAIRAYVQLFKPKSVLDIGTHLGWSAEAFAADIDGIVHTYDLFRKIDIPNEKIQFTLLPDPDACHKLDFLKFDFMFIDIDHHGTLEWKIVK